MIQTARPGRLRKATASQRVINLLLLFSTICAGICSLPPATAQGTELKITSTLASASQLSSTALPATEPGTTLTLGPGDVVNIQVYGRPELSSTSYVADDGTLQMPLAGSVQVSGLSPAQASQLLADALKKGKFLVNPQVSIILSQFRSQQVSVLGDVRSPARFPVEARTTVFDLLAQAGGITENGADVIYLLRPDPDHHTSRRRYSICATRRAVLHIGRGGCSQYVPYRTGHDRFAGDVPRRRGHSPGQRESRRDQTSASR